MKKIDVPSWIWAMVLTAGTLTSVIIPDTAQAGEPRSRRPWHAVRVPAAGPPHAIGAHGAGCVMGAERLAIDGAGYHVARPERHRHFGHPQLIAFVRSLGSSVDAADLGALLIGDLGQPRGGPATSGHASHQSGLDVDIWYATPERPLGPKPSAGARRALRARPMADLAKNAPSEHWSPRIGKVLALAAKDPRVDRMFVNPVVKARLCKEAGDDRTWLRKLRPWWGHHEHFHVRLACPSDSSTCRMQARLPQGDGCDELDWWLRNDSRDDRDNKQNAYRSRVRGRPSLPAACEDVFAADEQALPKENDAVAITE